MKTFFDYPLISHNSFGIDAYAATYIVIESKEDVLQAIKEYGLPSGIIGGGSNIILPSHIEGVVRHIGIQGIDIQTQGDSTICTIGAGENWHNTVLYTIKKGLWGIENLIAIPGDVGASPVQNIGAYGVELKDVFLGCNVYDTRTHTYVTLTHEECKFGYRDSIFKQDIGRFIILEVILKLSTTPHPILTYKPIVDALASIFPDTNIYSQQQIAATIENIRRSKLPKPETLGNCGSFFKNPIVGYEIVEKLLSVYPTMPHYPQSDGKEKLSAAWLIDTCGLKGYSHNHVGTYEKQPLVLVNKQSATKADVIAFSDELIQIIHQTIGVTLEREVNIW